MPRAEKRIDELFGRWSALGFIHGEQAIGHFFGGLSGLASGFGRPRRPTMTDAIDALERAIKFGERQQGGNLGKS